LEGNDELWRRSGLRQFQVVRCVVTAHRDRYGVEVELTSPAKHLAAFIDFVMLSDGDDHPSQSAFPPVGSALDAVAIDFMPSGELRLSARPSAVARHRVEEP
jgi:hypothetical protein